MDSTLLGKVPREMRDHIYRFALAHPDAIRFAFDEEHHHEPTLVVTNAADFSAISNGLRLTCRQLHQECRPIFLEVNTFAFALAAFPDQHGDDTYEHAIMAVSRFFERIGDERQKMMAVHFDTGKSYLDSPDYAGMQNIRGFALWLLPRLSKHARVTVTMRFEMEDFMPVEGLESPISVSVTMTLGKGEKAVKKAGEKAVEKAAETVEEKAAEDAVAAAKTAVEKKVAEFLGGEEKSSRLAGVQTIEAFGAVLESAVRTMVAVRSSSG